MRSLIRTSIAAVVVSTSMFLAWWGVTWRVQSLFTHHIGHVSVISSINSNISMGAGFIVMFYTLYNFIERRLFAASLTTISFATVVLSNKYTKSEILVREMGGKLILSRPEAFLYANILVAIVCVALAVAAIRLNQECEK